MAISRPDGHREEAQQAVDWVHLASESRCGRPQGEGERSWANADKEDKGRGG